MTRKFNPWLCVDQGHSEHPLVYLLPLPFLRSWWSPHGDLVIRISVVQWEQKRGFQLSSLPEQWGTDGRWADGVTHRSQHNVPPEMVMPYGSVCEAMLKSTWWEKSAFVGGFRTQTLAVAWPWRQSGTGVNGTHIRGVVLLPSRVETSSGEFLKQWRFDWVRVGLGHNFPATPSELYPLEVNLLASSWKYSCIDIPKGKMAAFGMCSNRHTLTY